MLTDRDAEPTMKPEAPNPGQVQRGHPAGAPKLAVIIPCYRAATTIEAVIGGLGPEVDAIYCVNDASPDDTFSVLQRLAREHPRLRIIDRPVNGGVGAAMVDGYRAAIADGMGILVKIDSDGQMDPSLIPDFVTPILGGHADYVKGNRFFNTETVGAMPMARIVGNAGLSFMTKLSTGYWDLFDPTNGYTAMHAGVAAVLPLERLHPRFFFESDLLFRLSTIQARVVELPLTAQYNAPNSHLSELRCLITFPGLHARNLVKRIAYNYFLRNFSLASVNLVLGTLLAAFGFVFGLVEWARSIESGIPATTGTVMLSALPFLLGIQFLLSFIAQDMAMTPREPIYPRLARVRVLNPRPQPSP